MINNKKFDCAEVEIILDYYKNEQEKHLKSYAYDSLVCRYQLALYKASLKDAEDIMLREQISKKEAEAKARRNYDRDLMKFCQILDKVIGDHD